MSETSKDPNPGDLSETPAEAAAEAQEVQVQAQEAIGQDLGDDGEGLLAEEEGIE